MAGFKFFNIGKANAEIDRLTAENAQLKAAKPTDETSQQLADALASNESISAELTKANADLSIANQTATTEKNRADAADKKLSEIGTALKTACAALKLEAKDGATAAEMISAMQSGVSATLARLQVDPGKVPAGKPATGASTADKKMSLDEEIKARQAASPTK